jgi:hypothetical protein
MITYETLTLLNLKTDGRANPYEKCLGQPVGGQNWLRDYVTENAPLPMSLHRHSREALTAIPEPEAGR